MDKTQPKDYNCPTCGHKSDGETDGLLKCKAGICHAIWRRVDIELEDKQNLARIEARRQEHESFRQLNNERNELAHWIRNHRPQWLTGNFTLSQLAIKAFVISDSMGTLPVQSPHLGLENVGRLKRLWHAVKTTR